MAQTIPHDNIQASLGDVSGQVAVGDYNVQIHAEHGAIVNFSPAEKQPRSSPRPSPQKLRPRPFALLDRKTEIDVALSSVSDSTPVQFYGPAGVGKTSLLRYLAYRQEVENLKDGVVFLSAVNQPAEDLLQSLFDAFFECDRPFKPNDAQLRQYFKDIRAAVLLDDVRLAGEQIGLVLNIAPGCAFVIASPEASLWGEGRAVSLKGLPNDDSLALIERQLGRALNAEEMGAARTINAALEGQPLRIVRLVTSASEQKRSLVEVAADLERSRLQNAPGGPAAHVDAESLEHLSEDERTALSVVAVFEGDPISARHIAALTGNAKAQAAVDYLVHRGLLRVEGDQYSIAGDVAKITTNLGDLSRWRNSALEYFARAATAAEGRPLDLQVLLKDSGAIRRLLTWGATAGRWAEVERLGRAIEGMLAVSGRWGAWSDTLQQILRAAQAMEKPAEVAWAMHQLGTRALCMNDASAAYSYLNQALSMRRSIGDEIGALVTEHNLDLLLTSPADEPRSDAEQDNQRKKLGRLIKRFFIPAAVVLLGALGIWYALPPGTAVVKPSKLDFKEQVLSVRSEPQAISISNPQWKSVGISKVAIEGPNADDFVIAQNDCSGSVSGERDCLIKVAFVPTVTGERTAKLIIEAGKGSDVTAVLLTGIGTPPPASGVAMDPDALSFTDQQVNVESEPQSIKITNASPQSFQLGRTRLIGSGAANFKLYSDCEDALLPAHQTCAISVTFLPTSAGPQSATLLITDAADRLVHARVLLTGLAREAENPKPGSPTLEVRPGEVDFGSLELGSKGQQRPVTILNGGSAPLKISNIAIVDGHADEFILDASRCGRAEIGQAGFCTLTVQFNPKTIGPHTANLRIDDHTNHLSRVVLLRGIAVAAAVRVEPSQVAFGSHNLGEKVNSQPIIVSNVGLAPLRIDSVFESGPGATVFPMRTDCNRAIIPPNGRCAIELTFSTRVAGKFGAVITISSNAANGRQTVRLSGEVLTPQRKPDVRFNPDPLDFGAVEVGKGDKRQITISNEGTAPLKIDRVMLIGEDAGEFNSGTKCEGRILAPNSSCLIEVKFQPKGTGLRSAGLKISGNPGSGDYELRILGSGAAVEGWCCVGKNVFQATQSECRAQKGQFGKTEARAKRACALDQIINSGVCCINGEKSQIPESECRQRGGMFYQNAIIGAVICRKRQPENGWCCIDGEVFGAKRDVCTSRRGGFFESRIDAERQCRGGREGGTQ